MNVCVFVCVKFFLLNTKYLSCFIDLKQELKVVERQPLSKKEDGSENDNTLINGHVSTRTQVEIETQTLVVTPQKRKFIKTFVYELYYFLCIFFTLPFLSCTLVQMLMRVKRVDQVGVSNVVGHYDVRLVFFFNVATYIFDSK